MNRKVLIISIVVCLLVFLRHVNETSPNLIYIVACINIVAIIYVWLTIIQRVQKEIFQLIASRDIPNQFKERKKREKSFFLWGTTGVGIIALVLIYFYFFCSSEGNDILSIIALGFSLIDDELVSLINGVVD